MVPDKKKLKTCACVNKDAVLIYRQLMLTLLIIQQKIMKIVFIHDTAQFNFIMWWKKIEIYFWMQKFVFLKMFFKMLWKRYDNSHLSLIRLFPPKVTLLIRPDFRSIEIWKPFGCSNWPCKLIKMQERLFHKKLALTLARLNCLHFREK